MNPQTQPDQGKQTVEAVSSALVEARRWLDQAAEHLARTPVMDTGARAAVCAKLGTGFAVLAHVEALGLLPGELTAEQLALVGAGIRASEARPRDGEPCEAAPESAGVEASAKPRRSARG